MSPVNFGSDRSNSFLDILRTDTETDAYQLIVIGENRSKFKIGRNDLKIDRLRDFGSEIPHSNFGDDSQIRSSDILCADRQTDTHDQSYNHPLRGR